MRNARKHHITMHAICFLTGLNSKFVVVNFQILLMESLPPMNKIFFLVLQHEIQVNFNEPEETSLVNAIDSQRFKGKTYLLGSFLKGNSWVCIYCGKTNHTIDTSYDKYGFPLICSRDSQTTLPLVAMNKIWNLFHKLVNKDQMLHQSLLNNMSNSYTHFNSKISINNHQHLQIRSTLFHQLVFHLLVSQLQAFLIPFHVKISL